MEADQGSIHEAVSCIGRVLSCALARRVMFMFKTQKPRLGSALDSIPEESNDPIVIIQSFVRMFLAMRRYSRQKDAVTTIANFYKSYQANK